MLSVWLVVVAARIAAIKDAIAKIKNFVIEENEDRHEEGTGSNHNDSIKIKTCYKNRICHVAKSG